MYDTFFYHGAHCHFYLLYIFHKKKYLNFQLEIRTENPNTLIFGLDTFFDPVKYQV